MTIVQELDALAGISQDVIFSPIYLALSITSLYSTFVRIEMAGNAF